MYDYISPSSCPALATHPLAALALHLIYLTIADWCAERCRQCTEQGLPPSSLPFLPRLHQSLVMATQPWWELLPVTWALRLRMSRIFAAVRTVWWLVCSIVVWCFGLRKRWRSGLVLLVALFWVDSGQVSLLLLHHCAIPFHECQMGAQQYIDFPMISQH